MKKSMLGLIMLVGLVLVGCAPKGAKPLSIDDTPINHYNNGMAAVAKGLWSAAHVNFERAMALAPGFAPGMAGQAFVLANEAAQTKDISVRRDRIDASRQLMKKALRKAKDDVELLNVYVVGIRAETLARGENWMKSARGYYEAGRVLSVQGESELFYSSRQALNFYMAQACFGDRNLECARTLLKRILASPVGRWHQPADTAFSYLQKLDRVSVNRVSTELAWDLLTREAVTRAEVAAILVSELSNSLKPANSVRFGDCAVLDDVVDHPYQEAIEQVLAMHVRGLDLVKDSGSCRYFPDQPVSRKELAMLLEDLLVVVTGEDGLATKYLGQGKSPYSDVRPHTLWYNSVLVVVNRNLMDVDLNGAFRPNDNVNGAALLLAVSKLRNAYFVQ